MDEAALAGGGGEHMATFEDLSIDDSLGTLERVERYAASHIALQRSVRGGGLPCHVTGGFWGRWMNGSCNSPPSPRRWNRIDLYPPPRPQRARVCVYWIALS
jgi:hypothetical protein